MQEFILSYDNLPYLVCLVVIAVLGFIELMARAAGISLIAMTDMPTCNPSPSESLTNNLGNWLCLDRMSALLWCLMAMGLFALLGFGINCLLWLVTLPTLPQSISVWIIFPLTGLACHWLGQSSCWRQDATEDLAVDEQDLGGRVAITTFGDAAPGVPAEALVRDATEQQHYVLVEPRSGEASFTPGTSVVLIRRDKNIWQATRI